MISQERIISLLGQGLSPEVVATAVGCDPSYISQLLSDESIRHQVSELRVKNLQSATQRDNKWDAIEDKLLDAVANKIETSADFMKPRELISMLAVVNSAKRRGAQAQEAMVINNTIVNLTIPQQAIKAFVLNESNQVVEVDGQTLLTMPSPNMRGLTTSKLPALKAPENDILGRNTSSQSGIKSPREIAEVARARLEKLNVGRGN